jgi:hypothetical protein
MKVIIAGSRTIREYQWVQDAVQDSGFSITEVVSGGAGGVDRLGERYAFDLDIPLKRFPADWGKHGKAAGPIRNGQMAEYAEALIAIHDGESRGTADMIRQAEKAGLLVYVKTVVVRAPHAKGGARTGGGTDE